ncbi:hypothetical protein V8B55DRAFT_1554507, partial [Mucor lusitanicus]
MLNYSTTQYMQPIYTAISFIFRCSLVNQSFVLFSFLFEFRSVLVVERSTCSMSWFCQQQDFMSCMYELEKNQDSYVAAWMVQLNLLWICLAFVAYLTPSIASASHQSIKQCLAPSQDRKRSCHLKYQH